MIHKSKNNDQGGQDYSLTIGWMYPDLMSTYGDRGNIIVLSKRCIWRGITVEIKRLTVDATVNDIKSCDLFLMGGAQDQQQEIVNEDLQKKAEILAQKIDEDTPGLFICGGYQFLGKYYKTADGTKIPGLGIFDLYTQHPGPSKDRLIGNIVVKPHIDIFQVEGLNMKNNYIVGFENHGGRTYLGKNTQPWGHVIKGFGNNGEDKTEGLLHKNTLGTYMHGPLLPKNPQLADYLINKALEVKYKSTVTLEKLDESLEKNARELIVKKY